MSDLEELSRPLTELEKAQLAAAASKPDHQLSAAGLMLLRRLMFQSDAKDAEIERLTAERDALAAPEAQR